MKTPPGFSFTTPILLLSSSSSSPPPLCTTLTSFQFTQSALPSRLAAPPQCDPPSRPIAWQAHWVPCEPGASLRYITAATGCHGNAHGQHQHRSAFCVCAHTRRCVRRARAEASTLFLQSTLLNDGLVVLSLMLCIKAEI